MVLSLGLVQTATFAEINSVKMQVDGMTCPFCVYGIEKKLESLEEVKEANANLKKGIVDINLKEGKAIDIEKLNKAVKKSGFTPGKIKVKAAGNVTTYKLDGEETPALKVTGAEQVFLLTSTPDHGSQETLGENRLSEMKKATDGGNREITITGYVHSHPAGTPAALSVKSFEVN